VKRICRGCGLEGAECSFCREATGYSGGGRGLVELYVTSAEQRRLVVRPRCGGD
jgi:hypothetical protein